MRNFLPLAAMLAAVTMAAPAHAFDVDQMLKQVFGSSDLKDLALPFFVLLAVVAVLFFWNALRIGKRRQQRMIENYNGQLQDYSTRLKRGHRL
ncbi:hypothetical protein OEG84_00750 [Hoeflea sp. G2-23]|uniref:Uncharacterized protein n=1 Tax=Hoeflea algicola TaxID=2983763 RepID=A0ABT3Z3G2_9HYPH|nr:hypothetical protein [Hoeflea algicola]MCY0146282.1 hypothetical protein [Hoeflea algicola]